MERYRALKAQGIDPNKPRGVLSQIPAKDIHGFRCNHCALLCEDSKALVKHKRTHNATMTEEIQYSLMPSCANWSN